MDIQYKLLKGRELTASLDELAKLRITVFREFPYLYEGSLEYEKEYLDVYLQSERSLVVLVYSNSQLIGASTCIPLIDESEEFHKAFKNSEYDFSKIFYFGESIILKEFRGHRIGHEFFKLREDHAKAVIPDLQITCFCSVNRPNHPLTPEGYRPLDEFWLRMGYERNEDLVLWFPWKDIDKDKEDKKSLTFYLKSWSEIKS